MRHIILATALALGLAACSMAPGTTTPTVTMTPAQVASEAQAVLTAAESAVTAYTAQTPVSATVAADIKTAEASAQAAVTALSTANLSNAPQAALAVANAIAGVVATLPPGVLPPAATAGVVAFQVFVAAIQPLVANTATASAVAPTLGIPVRVVLVANPA